MHAYECCCKGPCLQCSVRMTLSYKCRIRKPARAQAPRKFFGVPAQGLAQAHSKPQPRKLGARLAQVGAQETMCIYAWFSALGFPMLGFPQAHHIPMLGFPRKLRSSSAQALVTFQARIKAVAHQGSTNDCHSNFASSHLALHVFYYWDLVCLHIVVGVSAMVFLRSAPTATHSD